MTGDNGMIELERFWLLTLAKAAEGAGLSPVLQQVAPGAGRLWMVPDGKNQKPTTVPALCLQFKFDLDVVGFEIQFRDERPAIKTVVKYAEGLDGFLQEFGKALVANRLAAPKAA